MRDFINGLMRSKTIIFAVALAGLGFLEANMEILKPYLNSQTFAFFSVIVGIIVAMLRVGTTDSLEHKGNDERNARESDKPTQ